MRVHPSAVAWTGLMLVAVACSRTPNRLNRPNLVALGDEGQVYVSDFLHDRIVVFDDDGAFVRSFGRQGIGRGQLWRLTAMAVDADGHLVVANRRPASDAEGAELSLELKHFDDGRQIEVVTLDGTLQRLDWIDDIAQGPDGRWILANANGGELLEVDEAGRRVGRFGPVPGADAAPSTVIREGDDTWVIEQYRHRITRHRRGRGPEPITLGETPGGPPLFPTALGVCPDRWLVVGDLKNHRIVRYRLDGTYLDQFSPEPAGPDEPVQVYDLALTDDCERLYIVDSKGNRVLVTTPTGEVLQTLSSW